MSQLTKEYKMSAKCKDYPTDKNVELLINENVRPPFNIGETLPYTCKYGYILSDSSFVVSKKTPVFTCELIENSAVWQIDSKCRAISCGSPGRIKNADRKGLLFTFPEKVTFECHDGYKMKGINSRYCGVNGQWIPSLEKIKCELVGGCSYLNAPSNGSLTYTNSQFIGSLAHFSCEKGFRLSGNETRECLKNGIWSGTKPECKKISCVQPGPFPNGIISPVQKMYNFKDIVVYHCPLTNQSVIAYCTSNGNWSNAPPICENLKSPTAKQPNLFQQPARVNKMNLQNSTAYFICSFILLVMAVLIYRLVRKN